MSSERDERALIRSLATVMAKKLRQNSHKTHWNRENLGYFRFRLGQELEELDVALRSGDADKIRNEAADCANFLAMIIDAKERKP